MNSLTTRFLLLAGCFFLYMGSSAQQRYPVCGPQAKFYSKDSLRVITFGASTVEGVPAPLNFQNSLQAFIEHCYTTKPVVVFNNGVGGETTTQGLLRIDAALNNPAEFFMILMGANDAIRMADNQLRLPVVVSNMRILIEKAKAKNLAVIMGTPQYFVEQGSPAERLLARRRNRNIDLINTAYRGLASEYGLKLADINATLGRDASLYSPDGIHPNSRGYEVLSLVWFDALNQEIAQNFQSVGVVQNYPNPANTYTKVGFTLAVASRVKIVLFNSAGQNMGVILDDYRNAGYQEEQITTSQYPAGIYILYFELGGLRFSKKVIIVH